MKNLIISIISLFILSPCFSQKVCADFPPKGKKEPKVFYHSLESLQKKIHDRTYFHKWSEQKVTEELDRLPSGGFISFKLSDFNVNNPKEDISLRIIDTENNSTLWSLKTSTAPPRTKLIPYLEIKPKYVVPIEKGLDSEYLELIITWRGVNYYYPLPVASDAFKLIAIGSTVL